jgi:SAM-dependent methyltransferase
MPFSIDHVVPWGRSLEEYRAMFSLSECDLASRVLGCGDGPASFNAELSARGGSVVSVDPLYRFSASAIEGRVQQTFPTVMAQTSANRDDFVWTHVRSLDELGRRRMGALRAFLADFETGRRSGRYVDAALPELPFADDAFELALSSHFLFLYSVQFDLDFHLAALREMLRVANEVRVFPLLQNGGAPSPHVAGVREALTASGARVTVEQVPYEFQRGGNRMLRLRRGAASDAA